MMRVTGGPGRLMLFLGSCLLILIVISGLACQKKTPTDTKPETTAPAAPESSTTPPITVAPQVEKTIVTVNGKAVTDQELNGRVALAMRPYASRLASQSPQYAAEVQKRVRQGVLENLVAERLLDEQVAAAKIQATDAELEAEITKSGAQQTPPFTLEEFKKRVEASGRSYDDWKRESLRGMGYRKLMEPVWTAKAAVSDEEAKQYYDSHAKEFETPEMVRASHILALSQPKDPNADPNQVKAAAKAKAEKLLKQVKDGGDFAAIAKENSEDPGSAAQGGDLGFFARGRMVPPFEQAAFSMKPGQISDLVETNYGYHIIKVTDHKDAGTTPFEDAKAGIIEQLAKQKRATVTNDYIQSLKAKARIEYAPGEAPEPPSPVVAPAAPAPKPVAPTPSSASQPAATAPATAAPAPQPAPAPAPAPTPTTTKQ